jgi:nucleotide-binding universal stress UspA family protein
MQPAAQPSEAIMFKRILVAIDGSSTADQGLRTAIELAADQHAKLTVVHVFDDMDVAPSFDGGLLPAEYFDRIIDSMRQAGIKLIDDAEKRARDRGIDVKTRFIETLGQKVAQTIVGQARKHQADVIVLGTHGRRGVRRLLLGSDAEGVLRESPVPVLLVRSPEREKPHADPAQHGARSAEPTSGSTRAASQMALVSF